MTRSGHRKFQMFGNCCSKRPHIINTLLVLYNKKWSNTVVTKTNEWEHNHKTATNERVVSHLPELEWRFRCIKTNERRLGTTCV